MADTHRDTKPEPLLVPTVIKHKSSRWGDETRKVATSDAQRVLEAMLAEFGIDEAIRALDNQGFRGHAYRYLLTPLHQEAMARRERKRASANNAS